MSDLFDLLFDFRNRAATDRHQHGGGLFEPDDQNLAEFWRPVSNWHEPWLTDPTWPASLRTAQHRVMLLFRSERRYEYAPSNLRAGCTGCGWLSDERWSIMQALAEGLDHSHPGWWSQPIANSLKTGATMAEAYEWGVEIARVYPPGWFETGGPVRTYRVGNDTEPKQGRAPGGGWDVPASVVPKPAPVQKAKMVYVPSNGYDWSDDLVLTPSGDLVPEWKARHEMVVFLEPPDFETWCDTNGMDPDDDESYNAYSEWRDNE